MGWWWLTTGLVMVDYWVGGGWPVLGWWWLTCLKTIITAWLPSLTRHNRTSIPPPLSTRTPVPLLPPCNPLYPFYCSIGCGFIEPSMGGLVKTIGQQPTHATCTTRSSPPIWFTRKCSQKCLRKYSQNPTKRIFKKILTFYFKTKILFSLSMSNKNHIQYALKFVIFSAPT